MTRNAVVVVVPARDERRTIAFTLHSVCVAIGNARKSGAVGEAIVEVIAHRCLDDTAQVARSALRLLPDGEVTEESALATIGAVRDTGARRGLARLTTPLERSWVLSTDADTRVDPTWVTRILAESAGARAVGVVGLASLDRWRGTSPGAAAYDRVVSAKLRASVGLHQHDHVYGANLAIRADAYLEAGGFPHLGHGEDQRLVDTLQAQGRRLLRTRSIAVVTSGRFVGRAVGGLADHLSGLAGAPGDELIPGRERRLGEILDDPGARSAC